MRRLSEQRFYPAVERWARRHFTLFQTAVNRGLRHSRIDVAGVRDVGGDLSGAVETFALEVKTSRVPFATAAGQTLGYNVYANRVYLAQFRDEPFSPDELQIASHLGIGLVHIRNRRCSEVLSSPYYHPIEKLNLRFLETLDLGRCQFCGSVFAIGDRTRGGSRFSRLARENATNAVRHEKGLMFWNREVAERKHRMGIRPTPDGTTYERRFVCPDCVQHVFAQLLKDAGPV